MKQFVKNIHTKLHDICGQHSRPEFLNELLKDYLIEDILAEKYSRSVVKFKINFSSWFNLLTKIGAETTKVIIFRYLLYIISK